MNQSVKINLKNKLRFIFDFVSSDAFEALEDETKFKICTYFSKSLVNEYYARQIELDDDSEKVLVEAVLCLDYQYSKIQNKPMFQNIQEVSKLVEKFTA